MVLRSFWVAAFAGLALLLSAGAGAAEDRTQNSVQANQPNESQGTWLLGSNYANHWSHENAFTNRIYANQPGLSALLHWNGESVDIDKMIAAGDFDPVTGWIKKLPNTAWGGLIVTIVREEAPDFAELYHGDYILEWDGDADVSLVGSKGIIKKIGPNKLLERYRGSGQRSSIAVTRIGKEGVGNFRFYRAEYEDAIAAGERFTPEFVELVSRYHVLRNLEWNPINGSYANRADDLQPENNIYWAAGVPIEAQFELAMKADVALWLNVPAMIGFPDESVTAAQALPGYENQKKRLPIFTAGFDAARNSGEWLKVSRRIVAAMDKANYPVDREFYLELGNEVWNWGFINTEYFWGLQAALYEETKTEYRGMPMRGAYGYFTAHMATAFAQALDEAGRANQKWTMVVGSQTAYLDQTRGALQGVKDYKRGGKYKQPMNRYQVATTGYYFGGFHYDKDNTLFGRKMTQDQWYAEWMRRFKSDPDALAASIGAYLASASPKRFNAGMVVLRTKQHAAIADEFGARSWLQYEGESHDSLARELKNQKGVREFYAAWRDSEHHAKVIRAHARQMWAANPDAVLANYHHYGLGAASPNPWELAKQFGETTPAEAALLEMLRR